MLKQQAQKLGEEFVGDLQMTQLDIEGTQFNIETTLRDLEATRWEIEMQLEAVETQLKCGRGRNAEASTVKMKP